MSGCISAFRWVLSIFILLFLFLYILIGIPLAAITTLAIERELVKNVLKASGIYEQGIELTLETMSNQIEQDNSPNAYLESHEVKAELEEALEETIPPEKLEEHANTVIDAFYDWFEGKSQFPSFRIVLFEDEEAFASVLTSGLRSRLDSLPECEQDITPKEDFNPFEASCIPQGLDTNEIEQELDNITEFEDFDDVVENTTISADSISITTETTDAVQSGYNMLTKVPVFMFVGYIGLVLILLLLIPGSTNAFFTVGITSVIASLIVLAATFFTPEINDFVITTGVDQVPAEAEALISNIASPLSLELITILTSDIRLYTSFVLFIGIALIAAGIAGIVVRSFRREKVEMYPTLE